MRYVSHKDGEGRYGDVEDRNALGSGRSNRNKGARRELARDLLNRIRDCE